MNKMTELMQKGTVLAALLVLNPISWMAGSGLTDQRWLASATAAPDPQLQFVAPQLKSGSGQPGGRGRGAGSRGPCKKYESLAALVPATKTATKEFVTGLTTVEHPTFWFYIPSQSSAEAAIEFVLQDEGENDVYRTRLPVSQNSPGIVSVPVPTTVAPLSLNKSYRWLLAVSCDPGDDLNKVLVRGQIQRVGMPPATQKTLEATQTPLGKAILYARNGIWFDALTTLGTQLQQRDRKDATLSTAWADLLKQGNLDDLVTAPLLPCCPPGK